MNDVDFLLDRTTVSSGKGCCTRESARTTSHANHSGDFKSSVAEEVAIGETEKIAN